MTAEALVGAGIAGLTVAAELARCGLRVLVLEEAQVGAGASAGTLAEAFLLCPAERGEALLGASMALSLRDGTEGTAMPSHLARRALRAAPGLAALGVSRAWSGLRPTAPTGCSSSARSPARNGLSSTAARASRARARGDAIVRRRRPLQELPAAPRAPRGARGGRAPVPQRLRSGVRAGGRSS